MRRRGLAGILVIVSLVLIGTHTPAQGTATFVRVSVQGTPRVVDLSVVRQQRVEIASPDLLTDAQRSAALDLHLFADMSFRAVRRRLEFTAHGVTWIGTLEAYPGSSAIFTVVGDEVVGHVYAPFGFFRISHDTDGYLAQQIDSQYRARASDVELPDGHVVSATRGSHWATAADEGSVIDILVVYTQDALRNFRSVNRAQAEVDIAFAETNQAFRNSGVSTQLRLVHSTAVDYEETADSSSDLRRLRVPDDGVLDRVHALRDQYAADLVALVTEQAEEYNCGRTYLQTSAPGGAGFAFLVSKRECLGHIGTFPHEIGHQLGAGHDWYADDQSGAFPYSRGYVSVPGRFQDIMATFRHCTDANTGCDMLLFFANPALTHQDRRQGVPAGTATTCVQGNLNNPQCDADLATTFARMAPIVARFRDSELRLTTQP